MASELDACRDAEADYFDPPPATQVTVGAAEFLPWITTELQAIARVSTGMTRLTNEVLPLALGAKGSPGDEGEIAYVASRLFELYRVALAWPAKCAAVDTHEIWSGVLREAPQLTSNIVKEFRSFAEEITKDMPDLVARARRGEPVQGFSLTLSVPDMTPLFKEIESVQQSIGL